MAGNYNPKFYHATFGAYRDEIEANGLRPCAENSNWIYEQYINFFGQHPIFLSLYADLALYWFVYKAKVSEEIRESGYVLFEVHNVDIEKLRVDPIWHYNFEEDGIDGLYDIEYAECLAYLGDCLPNVEVIDAGKVSDIKGG